MSNDPKAPTQKLEREDIIQRQLEKLIGVVSSGQERSDKNHAETKVSLARVAGEVHEHGNRLDKIEREQNRLRDTGQHHAHLIDKIRASGTMNKVKLTDSQHAMQDSFDAMADHVNKVSEDNAKQTDTIAKQSIQLAAQAKQLGTLSAAVQELSLAYKGISRGLSTLGDAVGSKTMLAWAMLAIIAGSFLFSALKWALHL